MIAEVSQTEFQTLLHSLADQRFTVVFDIETGPSGEAFLRSIYDESKLDPPKDPGEFDAAAVKFGNMKDPAKIAAKIAEDREKHARAAENWVHELKTYHEAEWAKYVDAAPLSALHGRVVAIGYGLSYGDQEQPDLSVFLDLATAELEMLERFWMYLASVRVHRRRIIGHNSHRFDLPFLIRRSYAHGLKPPNLRTKYNRWDDCSADTSDAWALGDYKSYVKLDHLAKLFGVQGKMEGITGDKFHKLLAAGQESVAREYLRSDIVATHQVAKVLRLL